MSCYALPEAIVFAEDYNWRYGTPQGTIEQSPRSSDSCSDNSEPRTPRSKIFRTGLVGSEGGAFNFGLEPETPRTGRDAAGDLMARWTPGRTARKQRDGETSYLPSAMKTFLHNGALHSPGSPLGPVQTLSPAMTSLRASGMEKYGRRIAAARSEVRVFAHQLPSPTLCLRIAGAAPSRPPPNLWGSCSPARATT